MTVSQRNALARAWIEEGNTNSSNLNQLPPAAEAAEGGDGDSSSSNDGNDEPQKDVLETWMIMVRPSWAVLMVLQYHMSALNCYHILLGQYGVLSLLLFFHNCYHDQRD